MDYAKEYDRMVEQSNRQQAENAALKEQVAQQRNAYQERFAECDKYRLELTTLQSKSAAPVDALEGARNGLVWWMDMYNAVESDYEQLAKIDTALAKFKGEK